MAEHIVLVGGMAGVGGVPDQRLHHPEQFGEILGGYHLRFLVLVDYLHQWDVLFVEQVRVG